MVFRGRKPVIYLYPPSKFQDVSVQLSLAPSWSFSAVYPPPQTGSATAAAYQGTQSITWLVTADPSGRLVNKPIGTEVSYLYWEARSSGLCITPEPSRSSSPVAHAEIFEPMRPVLSPGDSVFLPKSEVPGYLDATLKTLGLHTEARTSFITYWLPNILEHEYIALRFLAQEAYEAAARLDVSPAPDVVTRVFMLFRGVASSDLAFWEPAIARAEDDINFWVDVVGVDPVRASNPALFRVLEWGGMEVR
ncbi:hypothetical protein BC834DRAFT_169368 [Gloeopeniophorella convolvens]|nr:hypothetical protein BC834DRAFT_169368 [Gloeopeniophorella convolvens]